MIAETISVGTELLLGQIVDTDAVAIAKALSSLGVALYYRTTVGDNEGRIREAVSLALSRSDLVITIGGLGPTMDDLTKEVVCDVMGASLVEHGPSREKLDNLLAARGMTASPNFFKQALLPKDTDGRGVPNPNGTAPGVIVEKDGKIGICLPGPPNELIPMLEQSVVPYLGQLVSGERKVILSRVLRITGIGEHQVEELTRDLLLSENPSVAPLAKPGECHLRITASATSEADAESLIAPREASLRARLGDAIYGIDDETLEFAVVTLLKSKRATVATAESCTGGLVAHRIATISGASDVFHTGIVAYANETKTELLDVDPLILNEFGAVSEQTCRQMAENVRARYGATFGVAITGIAGPTGGTAEKPVGLVYIGVATATETHIERHDYTGERTMTMLRASQSALALLRREALRL
ncbi:MAG TPA: competence/damage-inducible protein A [Capsulimonadaceae bacterium]|jgi:nicotinamide-nucleotide amidase